MPDGPSYACPPCGEEIRSLGMDFDGGAPHTWNDCCSPECGNRMDGIIDVLGEDSDDARVRQWRWNQWQSWAMLYARAERQRACKHDYEVQGGHVTTMSYDAGGMTRQAFERLACGACGHSAPGEPLGEAWTRAKA